MPSLMFVAPVHGRLQLASICLRQLRRTCDTLTSKGIAASAVIVGDQPDLDQLDVRGLGFAGAVRDNKFLGRKFNDGIQLAADPRYNDSPADYVVPIGSDDWVDHRLFLQPLPPPDTIVGFQWMSFVREDAQEIASSFLNYQGGSGIRIIPRQLVAALDYRPADESRNKGCDTSILRNLREWHGDQLKVQHWHLHERQIVDWKTPTTQINAYREVTTVHRTRRTGDPFGELAEFYPAVALEEMRDFYASVQVGAAA